MEEITVSPARVTRLVVSITPSSPSVSTCSVPSGSEEVSLRTVLNAIGSSEVSSAESAVSMVITVDSLTSASSAGSTVSFGPSVMLPASSTDLTVVKSVPSTVRDWPSSLTVT